MKKRKVIYIVLIALTLNILFCPLNVFAGNNDSLPSYGYSGKGDDLWKYNCLYSALRISIYWAPTYNDFLQGTEEVIQIGDTVDVSKTGPWYRVDAYTKRTIYWYMNKDGMNDGSKYKEKKSVSDPYTWTGLGEVFNSKGQDIVQLMPDVWDGTKEQWDDWFESPLVDGEKTYENIPEIAMLCNAEITKDNFKNGIYEERDFESRIGIYKIFFEPVIYPIIDGFPMAMTLRDLIRWEEAFGDKRLHTSDGKDLINWITPVFVYTANSQFLIANEPIISMYGKNSNCYKEAYLENKEPFYRQNTELADSYQVYYNSPSIDERRQQRAIIKEQLREDGGIIYNSMGVGIISTVGEKEEIEELEETEATDQNSELSLFQTIIGAAPRDNEPFDVTEGIPSGEDLYVQIIADSYVYHLVTTHVSGYVPTVVTVDHVDRDFQSRTCIIVVNKRYSYYEIKSFELYSIQDAIVENEAFPDKKIIITPSAEYKEPVVEITHQNDDKFTYHITGTEEEAAIMVFSFDRAEIRQAAEDVVNDPIVKSDKLIINGQTIIDEDTGLVLTDVKTERTDRDMLFIPNIKIKNDTLNGLYESRGIITYKKIYSYNPKNSEDTLEFDLDNINPVFVHTPVCANLDVSSDDQFNQHPSPASDASALILGRPFTIDISNKGNHRDIKGYGTKDYSKYLKDRQIRFEFDTYLGENRAGEYLEANTWHSLKELGIENSVSNIPFYTPCWVDTGIYNVELRNIAYNDPNSETPEHKANLNPANSMAFDTRRVEVSGRIFDFSITDIDDIAWEPFFRVKKGCSNSTNKAFYVGPKDINALVNANREYYLPVIPGKNDVPNYQNSAVKLGYAFKFELKTIGDFYDSNDYLKIEPSFSFVDKDGKNRQEVDLYYQTPQSPLIMVGSPQDTLLKSISLDFEYRNIDLVDFKNTAASMFNLRNGINDYSKDKWINSFPRLSQIGVPAYKYTEILLTEPLRTFIGPKNNIPSNVGKDNAFASAQKWYGEYCLPSDCLIVPKGTDLSKERNLTKSSSIFLKEGYLIVNFRDIGVGKDKDYLNPYVKYAGKTGNGWSIEGYNTDQGPWQLLEGDVLVYYADKRSTDDYSGTGTH